MHRKHWLLKQTVRIKRGLREREPSKLQYISVTNFCSILLNFCIIIATAWILSEKWSTFSLRLRKKMSYIWSLWNLLSTVIIWHFRVAWKHPHYITSLFLYITCYMYILYIYNTYIAVHIASYLSMQNTCIHNIYKASF